MKENITQFSIQFLKIAFYYSCRIDIEISRNMKRLFLEYERIYISNDDGIEYAQICTLYGALCTVSPSMDDR